MVISCRQKCTDYMSVSTLDQSGHEEHHRLCIEKQEGGPALSQEGWPFQMQSRLLGSGIEWLPGCGSWQIPIQTVAVRHQLTTRVHNLSGITSTLYKGSKILLDMIFLRLWETFNIICEYHRSKTVI